MQTITMTLPIDKWNIIFNALNQRPYIEVAQLLTEMKSMADAEITKSQQKQTDNKS